MDEGYILSNKFRRVIFDGLASGETDLNMITKKHRIVPSVAKKIIDEFISEGIIQKKGLKYTLTKEGQKLAGNI
jgi:predicted transcriptional regulator